MPNVKDLIKRFENNDIKQDSPTTPLPIDVKKSKSIKQDSSTTHIPINVKKSKSIKQDTLAHLPINVKKSNPIKQDTLAHLPINVKKPIRKSTLLKTLDFEKAIQHVTKSPRRKKEIKLASSFVPLGQSKKDLLRKNSSNLSLTGNPDDLVLTPKLIKKLKRTTSKNLNEYVGILQTDLLIALRIYDNQIWQRVNTKNISALVKSQDLIFNLFDAFSRKLIFSGIGNIVKHDKKTNNMTISMVPLRGEKIFDREFIFMHNYKPCDKKCKLDIKVNKIQELLPATHPRIESQDELGIKNIIHNLEKGAENTCLGKRDKMCKQNEKRKNDLKIATNKRIDKQNKIDQKETDFFPIIFEYKNKNGDKILIQIFKKYI